MNIENTRKRKCLSLYISYSLLTLCWIAISAGAIVCAFIKTPYSILSEALMPIYVLLVYPVSAVLYGIFSYISTRNFWIPNLILLVITFPTACIGFNISKQSNALLYALVFSWIIFFISSFLSGISMLITLALSKTRLNMSRRSYSTMFFVFFGITMILQALLYCSIGSKLTTFGFICAWLFIASVPTLAILFGALSYLSTHCIIIPNVFLFLIHLIIWGWTSCIITEFTIDRFFDCLPLSCIVVVLSLVTSLITMLVSKSFSRIFKRDNKKTPTDPPKDE